MTDPIKITELENSPAKKLFSWPKYNEKKASETIKSLLELGVKSITLDGPQQQGKIRFLGKGHVGIVVESAYEGQKAALKIRRTDADRQTLKQEAENLKQANKVKVGPELYAFNDDLIVMELIEGKYFPNWLEEITEREQKVLRKMLKELLEKTRKLDAIRLDHGELGKIKRHVIMEEYKPRIIDFESASTRRRPSNVTSISQFLFINRHNRQKIDEIHQLPTINKLIQALKTYKKERNDTNFQSLLKTLNLRQQH